MVNIKQIWHEHFVSGNAAFTNTCQVAVNGLEVWFVLVVVV